MNIALAYLRTSVVACIAAFWVGGCSLQGPYQRPITPAPAVYRDESSIASTAPPPADWWTVFGDERLNALIKLAIDYNQDLAAAYSRYEEARSLLGVARADRYPTVSVDPDATRFWGSYQRHD